VQVDVSPIDGTSPGARPRRSVIRPPPETGHIVEAETVDHALGIRPRLEGYQQVGVAVSAYLVLVVEVTCD
jgi:hypothetical protein